MRIHSDILTDSDLFRTLPPGLIIELTRHGSRKRERAFEVSLEWIGDKVKGDGRHRRNRNIGGGFDEPFAATWDEWGIWLAALYEIDHYMKATYYENRADFYNKTRRDFEGYRRDKGAKAPWLSA